MISRNLLYCSSIRSKWDFWCPRSLTWSFEDLLLIKLNYILILFLFTIYSFALSYFFNTSVCPSNAFLLYKLLSVIYFYFSGNCLGIREDGNLNEYTCEKFVSGCPQDDYISSEIHECTYLFNLSILLLAKVYFNPTHFLLQSSSNYEGLLVYLCYWKII